MALWALESAKAGAASSAQTSTAVATATPSVPRAPIIAPLSCLRPTHIFLPAPPPPAPRPPALSRSAVRLDAHYALLEMSILCLANQKSPPNDRSVLASGL